MIFFKNFFYSNSYYSFAANIWKELVYMLVQNHLILQITDYLSTLTAFMETLSNVQPKQLLAWNAQLAA